MIVSASPPSRSPLSAPMAVNSAPRPTITAERAPRAGIAREANGPIAANAARTAVMVKSITDIDAAVSILGATSSPVSKPITVARIATTMVRAVIATIASGDTILTCPMASKAALMPSISIVMDAEAATAPSMFIPPRSATTPARTTITPRAAIIPLFALPVNFVSAAMPPNAIIRAVRHAVAGTSFAGSRAESRTTAPTRIPMATVITISSFWHSFAKCVTAMRPANIAPIAVIAAMPLASAAGSIEPRIATAPVRMIAAVEIRINDPPALSELSPAKCVAAIRRDIIVPIATTAAVPL